MYLHTSDSNGIGTVTPGFDPHRTIPTVSFFLCWELRSRSTWVFDEIKLLPKTSKYLTPTQKCRSLIYHMAVHSIYDNDTRFWLQFKHARTYRSGWYVRPPHFYRVVLNLIKRQKKQLVDPIKEIFQMTLLISPNPLMVKLLHKYLSVWLSGGEAPIHRTGWTRIPRLKWR